MTNKSFNIYLSGVGGQGIGLISETILRALDHAGKNAIGVDTHGLAQRGGIVASQIRFGTSVHSPVVSKHSADIVISLERSEALRAASDYLKPGGTLVYYDTCWQPLSVRLGSAKEITGEQIQNYCNKNSFKLIRVHSDNLPDPRMQNMSLLSAISHNNLISGVSGEHYEKAMSDLMPLAIFESNLKVFRGQ